MPAPFNSFKAAVRSRQPQIGLWLGLANPYTAEIAACAGFDWLLIDGEHAPNDIPTILAQLQAIASRGVHSVVRVPIGEPWLIKQVLDLGAQTILIPMVESVDQARALVRSVRYPPHGSRGVGSALARASSFNLINDYLSTANDQICLLLQIESMAGLESLDEIAAVEGVDGIFIGPADLAADMGHLGKPDVPLVQETLEIALKRIASKQKAAGILTGDACLAKRYLELGATFVAVGTDVTIFSRTLHGLAGSYSSRHRQVD